jgi:hypothetical protein
VLRHRAEEQGVQHLPAGQGDESTMKEDVSLHFYCAVRVAFKVMFIMYD